MSYYRDVYLKSDDWKSLRFVRLGRQKFRCQVCGKVDEGNDVHHIAYKHLYDVTEKELRVLCRKCHNDLHTLIDTYPAMRKLTVRKQWKIIKDHLCKGRRDLSNTRKSERRYRYLVSKAERRFCATRNVLVFMGLVQRSEMLFCDHFAFIPGLIKAAKNWRALLAFNQNHKLFPLKGGASFSEEIGEPEVWALQES